MTRDPHSCVSGGGQDDRVDDVPVRVAAVMARLLHTLPPPADAHDPDVLTTWLATGRTCSTGSPPPPPTPASADDARAVAAAARHTLADLTARARRCSVCRRAAGGAA